MNACTCDRTDGWHIRGCHAVTGTSWECSRDPVANVVIVRSGLTVSSRGDGV